VIEAVLWDNDGILVDTETLFFEFTRQAFAAAGAELSRERWIRSYLGEGIPSREIAKSLGIPAGEADRMLDERNEAYRRRLALGVPVRSGVRETLSALRGRVRMAVVTSSPRDQIDLIHRSTGLLEFFECVVTSDDCDRIKPAPDPYLAAVERLRVSPERCLAVEDSARGVASAAAAGIRCVLVPHELTAPDAGAGAYRVEPEIGGVVVLVGSLLAARSPERI
jgi:HAD superfamily hydrolase (TIGR01509 family)